MLWTGSQCRAYSLSCSVGSPCPWPHEGLSCAALLPCRALWHGLAWVWQQWGDRTARRVLPVPAGLGKADLWVPGKQHNFAGCVSLHLATPSSPITLPGWI